MHNHDYAITDGGRRFHWEDCEACADARTIEATTTEHLGPDATDFELRLYKAACWQLVSDLGMDEASALEEVWNGGDFWPRTTEILGLDPAASGDPNA